MSKSIQVGAGLNKVVIDQERCKGCGYCVIFCPQKVIAMADFLNSKGYSPAVWSDPEKKCKCLIPLCYVMCPDIAIDVWRLSSDNIFSMVESKPEEKK